jgi:UDP-N-acetylglucosamine diphosphorylase/glucosamine-1-phosphate N-acetyltransferase
MRILLYEDSLADQLAPVALLRPVFELICGRDSLRRRLQRWFPAAEFGAWIRPWMVDAYAAEQPALRVNDPAWVRREPVLLINGRWLPERRLTPLDFVSHQSGCLDGVPVWTLLSDSQVVEFLHDGPAGLWSDPDWLPHAVPAGGSLVRYPWDLVQSNGLQLIRDFEDEGISQTALHTHVQVLGADSDVYLSAEAVLEPYVVIDTRNGPVTVDRDARVQSFTRIEGPCHIGRGTQLFRAQIRGGTTIGEQCRVGGEVEAAILHSFVNKYHDGFVGHSYVCPWVNLGAMSCTSDLKNDYSTVQVPLQGTAIDTGLQKVGSFIGDHSKAAMNSMFNAGSSVGVMASLLTGGRLLPRHVPSFSSVVYGELTSSNQIDSAIETARRVMQRREQVLHPHAAQLLRIVHQRTEMERQAAFQRVGRRKDVTPAHPDSAGGGRG